MKIAHASIPADEPARVAAVLAEILQGEALPFPPAGPNGWMAWAGDGSIDLEVVMRSHVITHGEAAGWRATPQTTRFSEVHLAICVNRPETEIIAIAQQAGWTAQHCERGGGAFSLCEVWVENAFMIEFLDPDQTARYNQVVTLENCKRLMPKLQAMMQAPA
jgi:hypothetical protein